MCGWGGKAGIDGFLLITGYYMCEQEISLRKWFSAISLVLIWGYVVFSDYMKLKFGFGGGGFYPVDTENKLMAVVFSVSLFIIFKNMNVKYNKYVNAIASTTLGVLCIHANGTTMRYMLWDDCLKVGVLQSAASTGIWILVFVVIPPVVFVVCAVIDLGRQRLFRICENKIDEMRSKKNRI